MKRRNFIALLSRATAASAAWPLAVGAQTPRKIPRVGYISGSGTDMTGRLVVALQQGFSELGYVDGQTIALEVRMAARAQQATMPVVGFLNRGSRDGYAPYVAAFHVGLRG
jgi:hypothetical protein